MPVLAVALNAHQPRVILGAVSQDLVEGTERTRGRPIVVPRWWLDEVKDRAKASGLTLIQLGVELAAAVKRDLPWNHGSVSRFLRGERVTDDLVEAFRVRFDMPKPVYYPRDLVEAQLFKEAESKRERRVAEYKRATEHIERQTAALPSTGEASGRRRGARPGVATTGRG